MGDYSGFFKGRRVLITGGTGSFGNTMVTTLLKMKPAEIIVFSRDEKKQYDMQMRYGESEDALSFMIGDIRDYNRIYEALDGVDTVYQAAALKQVPNCEFNPVEAVKTNILGACNVKRAAIERGVSKLVSISTDKAVKPINVMGMTKALQEKIMLVDDGERGTATCCVRYGNVIGSRGSVIPLFKKLLDEKKPLTVTDPNMTRFLLPLEDAVDLVLKTTVEGKNGELFVMKMPACTILDLAKVMSEEIAGRDDYPIKVVGARPGEKVHEVLVSEEEMRRAEETENHYIIKRYVKKPKSGEPGKDYEGKIAFPAGVSAPKLGEYTSENTERLDHGGIKRLLKKTGWL